MTSSQTPSILNAVGMFWRERVPRVGFRRSVSELSQELLEFLRDSTPERRRLRYGDMDYDWEHRVDTTSATVGWKDRLLGVFHSPYQPTDPAAFREMMDALEIDFARFTFIDLGSGKGRTLLMAADYPFRRIIGVELLPQLHQIASDNATKTQTDSTLASRIETICGDACEFVFPSEPTVLYLFNPLPEAGLDRVMQNLDESLRSASHEIWVVYHNPLLEQTLAACQSLRIAQRAIGYVVYTNQVTLVPVVVSK